MIKLDKTLPEGTRDYLYSEAGLYKELTEKLADIFESSGFNRVMTPVIEKYDLISATNRSLKQENLYKLVDNTGRLIVIRPDNTAPIARVVATKLSDAPLPERLYYTQSIYRINDDYSGKTNEILQSGVEIVGSTGVKSDLECIVTALEVLDSLGMDYKLEIGNVGFVGALISDLDLSEDEKTALKSYVETKNSVSLNMFDSRLQNNVIRQLPLLFGGEEIFEEAYRLAGENKEATEAIDYVKLLYRMLVDAGYGDRIMIDLGIVHKFDYYTGTVFRGYVDNAGEPVIKGGRYDRLLSVLGRDLPATGFAVNLCAVIDAILKSGRKPDENIPGAIIFYNPDRFADAVKLKRSYIEKGISCVLSSFDSIEQTREYASRMNIGEVVDLSAKD